MLQSNKLKKIMFSGGGSGGPVIPLLVVAEELLRVRSEVKEIIFIGTNRGPEQQMVADVNNRAGLKIRFIPLLSGKWRRYFSWQNFLDIFKVILAFFISLMIIWRERPSVVISAGGFVSVPLVWAAAIFRISVIIHQQDVRPGLANRLMAPAAKKITLTFSQSVADYPRRSIVIGNPIRELSFDSSALDQVRKKFNLNSAQPLVLAVGGGTGADGINRLFWSIADSLTHFTQVVHIVGPGKLPAQPALLPGYQMWEILPHDDYLALLFLADVVVSRAGLASLSELSAYRKATILIPMPDSHQEDNAALAAKQRAAIVLPQASLSPANLQQELSELLLNEGKRRDLQTAMSGLIKPGATAALAKIIEQELGDKS